MYNYPFFSFPSFRNYNYYQSQHNKYTNNTIKKFQTKSMINEEKNSSNNKHRNFNTCIDFSNSHTNTNTNTDTNLKKHPEIKKDNNEVFEIFGIKLHFDDILLICLIFFLYSEGVKDDYLFISLILLLLS